ncbi:MAG: hypothetical protein GY844_25895 [Bradyrhizobium sp.]|nr:hypothetical protein [Bradyrhizobium sp.]
MTVLTVNGPVRRLFRVGPVLMLVPTILWAAGWNWTLQGENDSWYIIGPLIGFLIIVLVWHLALLLVEKNRFAYFGYALVHLPLFWVTYEFAMMFATRFPL